MFFQQVYKNFIVPKIVERIYKINRSKVKAIWSFEAQQDLASLHGVELDDEVETWLRASVAGIIKRLEEEEEEEEEVPFETAP